MRHRIENELGVEIFDICGLMRFTAPAMAFRAASTTACIFGATTYIAEIVDPKSSKPVPDGNGRAGATTLRKRARRYSLSHARPPTRIIPAIALAAWKHPRIDTLTGRTDDMVKGEGLQHVPRAIEGSHWFTDGASSGVSGHD